MRRILFSGLLAASLLLTVSCTTQQQLAVRGVPGWLANGAKLQDEPQPYRPDPAIKIEEEEDGPVHFSLHTDRRTYPAPPVKKAQKPTLPKHDLIERGRHQRIKRVVR